ncbi:MAG: D-alanine--D-alanine ligase [Coriobacteriales bacterium]|nr:D-alanine--D-alanine ligase [Coriobacteriales bacterium]
MASTDVTRNRVAVLAGGWSDESDISLESGENVVEALTEAGFNDVELLNVADSDFVERFARGSYDIAFIAMHGRFGEDGCIQGLCEILHIPYTFSGVLPSALATAKDEAKMCYRAAGIPTPDGITVPAGEDLTEGQIDQVIEQLGMPLFVKPACNGSSFGVTRVTDRAQLHEAIAKATSEGDNVLIENCIEGMEITVPVVGNDDPSALPIVEIVTNADFYDVKVKYEPGSLHHVIPARLEPGVYAKAQQYAVAAHKALGCRGCSRSDFIVKADGTPVILETNPVPGMTKRSLLPDSARHGGIEFSDLCKKFIELALEDRDKQRNEDQQK